MSGALTTGRLLFGVVAVFIDGEAYDVVSDCSWNPSTVRRETVTGQTRVEGFSEVPAPGFIAFTIRDRPDKSVRDFNGLRDSTVQVQQANGKTIYGDGMWNTDVGEVRVQEASFALRFEGLNVSEELAR